MKTRLYIMDLTPASYGLTASVYVDTPEGLRVLWHEDFEGKPGRNEIIKESGMEKGKKNQPFCVYRRTGYGYDKFHDLGAELEKRLANSKWYNPEGYIVYKLSGWQPTWVYESPGEREGDN